MTEPILERDPKLRLVVDRLIEAYAPERIYLFGSIARGDAGSGQRLRCHGARTGRCASGTSRQPSGLPGLAGNGNRGRCSRLDS
jgi:hypothetical protein